MEGEKSSSARARVKEKSEPQFQISAASSELGERQISIAHIVKSSKDVELYVYTRYRLNLRNNSGSLLGANRNSCAASADMSTAPLGALALRARGRRG